MCDQDTSSTQRCHQHRHTCPSMLPGRFRALDTLWTWRLQWPPDNPLKRASTFNKSTKVHWQENSRKGSRTMTIDSEHSTPVHFYATFQGLCSTCIWDSLYIYMHVYGMYIWTIYIWLVYIQYIYIYTELPRFSNMKILLPLHSLHGPWGFACTPRSRCSKSCRYGR